MRRDQFKKECVTLCRSYLESSSGDDGSARVAFAEIEPDAHMLHHVCMMLAHLVTHPEATPDNF